MKPETLTPAQRSNFLPLTAWGYAWWRARSLSLLSGEHFPLAREARLFVNLARPTPNQRWLDVGTSTGFYAGVLAGQGCRVNALDLSPAMLREAARREPGALIHWRCLNAEQTRLPAATFDGITIGATLNETAHPETMLREAARLLRPGGQLWLMYVSQGGSLGQRVLGWLAGLKFPDLSWISRALPEFTLIHAAQFGAVEFALYRKATP